MAREDAKCLRRCEPRTVLAAHEKDNDSAAALERRVEPSHLIRLLRVSGDRSGRHSPKQREPVVGAVTSPTCCRSTRRDQLDQELQILSPVPKDDGPLEAGAGDEDEAGCGSVRISGDGSGHNRNGGDQESHPQATDRHLRKTTTRV